MDAREEYIRIIKREYESRARRNPAYSMRSFAKFLEISSARLSEILNHKQGLSSRWANRIAERLNFSPSERGRFSDLTEAAHGRSPAKRLQAKVRLAHLPTSEVQLIQLDVFHAVSDWHHFAITELTFTQPFRSDPQWIARRLGIDRATVELAIERLLRIGLLQRKADGTLTADPKLVATPSDIPSEAVRNFHSQVLELASRAIHTQSVSERDMSTLFMPIDVERLPRAKKLIREFRRSFSKELGPMDRKNSVYSLSIQFFRVDKR